MMPLFALLQDAIPDQVDGLLDAIPALSLLVQIPMPHGGAVIAVGVDWSTVVVIAVVVIIAVSVPAALQAVAADRAAGRVEAAIQELHLSLNSRLTQLLDVTAKSSRFEGAEDERARNKRDP